MLQEIINLITTPPGNLTYYLVVAFSILGTWGLLLYRRGQARLVEDKRAIIALTAVILLWMLMSVLAGLSWQGLIDERLVMPPLDRSTTLLSIILIAWIWVFPRPSSFGNALVWLLSLAVTGLTVWSLIWWSDQGGVTYYDGTLPDLVVQLTAMTVLVLACILLFLGRPNGYGVGFGMLITLLVGYGVYLLQLPLTSDYAGAIRLAQMAAYPLLLALPLRFALPSAEKRSAAQPPVSTRRIHGIDPVLVEQFLALGIEYDPRKITQAVTRTVANAVPAEICLLVSTVDERKTLTIYGGYDVVRERYLDGLALRGEALPAVTSALRDGLPLYLSPAEPYLDLDTLSKALYLGPPGYLLCAPILADSGDTIAGLLLLSPYTRTGFAPAEQATLASFTNPLAQLLQRTQVLAAAAAVERAVAPAGRGEAREAPGAAEGYAPGGEPGPSEAYHLEAELRLALEEIARLKGSLSESDQQLLLMKNQMDVTYLSADQNQALVDTVQELRQTMAAVMGYTDFLLNESVGILGSLQRRFLERVKLSTERMNRLVDDLVQITSLKDVRRLIHFDPADLHEIIAEAIANTESQRTAKNITLHLDVPQELPQVCTDRIALQQVLTNLLDNAGEVTPADDEITLRAVVQSDDLDRQFFLIQVSDSGGGISIADIPRVFTRLPRGQAPHVFPGVSPDHNNLYIAKRLVDALSGRIWVDSEPNLGSTFSLLLQATPDGAGENGSGGPPA